MEHQEPAAIKVQTNFQKETLATRHYCVNQ